MRAIVTGGSGFIGSHVVDSLVDSGLDVGVVDMFTAPHRLDVDHIKCSIVDLEALEQAFEGADYVFHLAAVANVNDAFDNPLGCVELNVQGTANVLEAARRKNVKRVIFASTVWVYSGSRGDEVHEDSPFFVPDAGHVYTSTKLAGELLCHDYKKLYDLDFTILRYGIPYGPRMRDSLIISIFINRAMKGQTLTIMGDGKQHRNFVYVEDLARAHVMALEDKAANQIYNLEGLRKITVEDVANAVRDKMGDQVDIEYLPARPGDYRGKEVSADKALRELNWTPKVDFEEGMQRTVDWFQANRS
jgi:UDP-glucose 4-epimerase